MSNTATTPEAFEFTMADRLRKARLVAGLTQDEMADTIGVTSNTIGNYETGATTNPRRIVIRQWALATGAPIAWLYTGDNDPDDMEFSSTKWYASPQVAA